MDKIGKSLKRLTSKERTLVAQILQNLHSGKLHGLDIKKLKGSANIFRIRKGKLRIIYRVDVHGSLFLLAIQRRNENTYKL